MSWVHQLEEQEHLIPPPSPLVWNQQSPSPIVEDNPQEEEVLSAPPLSQSSAPLQPAQMMEPITTEQMLQLMQQMQLQILNLQQQNQALLGHLPTQQTSHVAPTYCTSWPLKRSKFPLLIYLTGKETRLSILSGNAAWYLPETLSTSLDIITKLPTPFPWYVVDWHKNGLV